MPGPRRVSARIERPLAWMALTAAALAGCTNFGPPSPTDAAAPPECQRVADQCRPAIGDAAVSTADDCVRVALDPTTTAQRCVEIEPACRAACAEMAPSP